MKYFRKFLFVVKVFVFLFFVFILGNVAFYLYAYITPKIDINSNNSIVFYDNEGFLKVLQKINGHQLVIFLNMLLMQLLQQKIKIFIFIRVLIF